MARLPFSDHATRGRSRIGGYRPIVEGLEGRALLSSAGTPDPSFATGGEYITPVHPVGGTGLNNIYALNVQTDGKVVVGGIAGFGESRTYGVFRLDANGTLDTSFGQGGEADLPMPSGFFASAKLYAEKLQPDGKIVLAGTISNNANQVASIVARLNADGSPDASFGNLGISLLNLPGLALNYATVQPNGKIVLAGSIPTATTSGNTEIAVARLDANGALDTSFGADGLVGLSGVSASDRIGSAPIVEKATGVAIASNGQIVLVGDTSVAQAASPYPIVTGEVFRLNADGSIDGSISQEGMRAANLATTDINGVLVQPDSKILVIGNAPAYPNGPPVLARLNPDGTLNGLAPLPHPDSGYVINAFALQSNGQIVLTGDEFDANFFAIRINANLSLDTSFGTKGEADLFIVNDVFPKAAASEVVAIAPDGRIVQGGTSMYSTFLVVTRISGGDPGSGPVATESTIPVTERSGDYLGNGFAQPTVYLPSLGAFAIRSPGLADQILPFGIPGNGQTIPAPGDYDGSGQTDLAVYLPVAGDFAYRPAKGGPDVVESFGIAGVGQTIPAPGDYDGTGRDNIAAYLPSLGAFAIRSPGLPDRIIAFGIPGNGQSIPAPGDYFGTGQTDLAVYLPSQGAFAIRNPAGGPDQIIPFGLAGAGESIPMPGDYDGSGRTELAVYLPAFGLFAYRPANGGPDVVESFGIPGNRQTIPAPGDYDGSGRTELAAYLPLTGQFAYRPANHAPDVVESFGIPGYGQTLPATEIPLPVTSIGLPTPAEDLALSGLKKGNGNGRA